MMAMAQTAGMFGYRNINGTWTKIGDDIDGEAAEDYSGYSVSLSEDGSIVAIGAPRNTGKYVDNTRTGHVRIYENKDGAWVKIGDFDGEFRYDSSGTSVSLSDDGSVVAIGAPYNDGGIGWYLQ